jgi:GAF domain-containing protein
MAEPTKAQLLAKVATLEAQLAASARALTEALDQQTATSAILGVISSSPTDIQPVFDTIMRSTVRLSGARFASILRFDGEMVHFVAQHGSHPDAIEIFQRMFPMRPDRSVIGSRSILDRAVVHVPDVFQDAEFQGKDLAQVSGWSSAIAVPMLREGTPVGAIVISKAEPGLFPDGQIALLQTFADQAVIAIENVRLFNETKEALEQQTATSEILRVISQSRTDTQPVFDTIVRSATRLCDGLFSALFQFDGELLHQVAQHNYTSEALEVAQRVFPARPTRAIRAARAILDRAVVHVPDVELDPEFQPPALGHAIGYRGVLCVPMLREGAPIGVISVGRAEPGPFSSKQIELLQTFADQAVIAIENVRLFTELQASNRDLTAALDTQTATSDILRVISRSQTDVQPVFDAIVDSAVRLLHAYSGTLTRSAGDQIELAALTSTDDAGDTTLRAAWPQSLQSEGAHAQAIRDRAPLNVADAHTDPRVPEYVHATARARGYRSLVVVPLLRHDESVGAISVTRREPGGFTDDEIALLKTFADQAVIAIENVRLFTELQTSNRELTTALDTQTATSEILRVISRSQTDVQPVFDTIVRNAVALCDGLFSALFQFDGALMDQVAQHNYSAEALAAVRRIFPMPANRATTAGRAILDRAVATVPDVELDSEYPGTVPRALGARSVLGVPMLRGGVPIGAITVARAQPGLFSDAQIELLTTFADQAVIAIENVRLFTELQEKNAALTAAHAQVTEALEQQTATSEILQVIAGSPTDTQPVFAAIAENSARLCGVPDVFIVVVDGDRLRMVAATGQLAPRAEDYNTRRVPVTRGSAGGRAIIDRTAVHIDDLAALPETEFPEARDLQRMFNHRTMLVVPLLREASAVGAIALFRFEVRPFSERQVELLKTFADQAVIAIENVRLFTELQASNRELTTALEQQTATSEVLRVISRSQTELQPVFDAISDSASRLCGADLAGVFRVVDGQVHEVSSWSRLSPEFQEMMRRTFPRPLDSST